MLLKRLFVIAFVFLLYMSYVPTLVYAQAPAIESFSSTGTIGGVGTTVSINLPSGATAGDLLVACVATAGNDTSNISADGWTHVVTAGGTAGATPKIGMLYRFWQPGDSDPTVYTISTSTDLSIRRGVMWRISGADATPSDAEPSFNVSGPSTPRVYNSITTNTNDALLLGCLNWTNNDSVYTPDGDLSNTVIQNRHAADSGVQTIAGATGNFTGSGNTAPYASIFWAVAPGDSPINNVPVVTLNSPSNEATGIGTTPTFTFTGTDDENDDLTYEIQISDNPDDFIGGEVLADNFSAGSGGSFHPQPHSTASTWQGNIQVDDRMCQSFTAQGGIWTKAVFPLGDSRDDTSGTAYARIYEHDGVFGTSSAPANAGVPTDETTAGTPTIDWLAESDSVVLGANFTPGDFDFAATGVNQIRFNAGEHYLVCADWIPNNRDLNNTWAWSGDVLNSGTLHDGNLYHDGYSSFNHGVHADWDLHFSIYELFTLEEADSSSDTGFVNNDNESDTSPFTAGDQLSYSVQAELEEGITYYWRVRANDGTVTGDWATTQSFTTSEDDPTPTPSETPIPTSTNTPIPTATNTPTPTPTWVPPDVESIAPSSEDNDQEVVPFTVTGTGFQTGASVKLSKTGETDIEGTDEIVGAGGTSITGNFDINGAETGIWDVVVTNTDTQSDTLLGGFTINAAPEPTATPTLTPEPTDTPTPTPTDIPPTPTNTPIPTATTIPPTATLTPTSTNTPTPTPTWVPPSQSSSTITKTTKSPPQQCTDSKPDKSPDLFQIDVNNTQAILYFAPVSNTNKYYIAYSDNENIYQYGVEFDTEVSNGVLSYTVNMLAPNTTYYFTIRGGNGCMPGDWGNKMMIKTSNSAQSGTSFYKNFASRILSIFPRNITNAGSNALVTTETINSCLNYTVKAGDNLWNIAQQNLGNGIKYVEIMQKNKLNSTLINIGQVLQIGC